MYYVHNWSGIEVVNLLMLKLYLQVKEQKYNNLGNN
jgi:hypothetical protein